MTMVGVIGKRTQQFKIGQIMVSSNSGIRRIILKLSGEALMGDGQFGISSKFIEQVAEEIKPLLSMKIELGIVVGGGNFFRGARLGSNDFSRITGDQLGMVATVINALAIGDVFKRLHITTRVISAITLDGIVERYDYLKVDKILTSGTVVVFAAGTGHPLSTTDTALCLRGIELNADLLLKATNVDGVYSHDPKQFKDAKLYNRITYKEALEKNINVMDIAAFSLGRDHHKKIVVFNIHRKGAILRIVQGLSEGTVVEN